MKSTTPASPPRAFPPLLSVFLRGVGPAIKLSLHCQTLTGCTNPQRCRSSADPYCFGRTSGLRANGPCPPQAPPSRFTKAAQLQTRRAGSPVRRVSRHTNKAAVELPQNWHIKCLMKSFRDYSGAPRCCIIVHLLVFFEPFPFHLRTFAPNINSFFPPI